MRMLSSLKLITALSLSAAALTGAGKAQAIEDTIVYLECTLGDKTSRGTGVIVSADGLVLTAKHVVPDGASCKGSIGVADSNNAARMVIRPTITPVDAALLQFSQNRTYAFAGYCELKKRMIREEILIAGFPGRTETGVPSYRQGILSTVFANTEGILETDAQSVAGMSGGPVYSKDLNGIVGIVIGAQFTPQGTPEYYGILPVETVANSFQLQESETPCYAPQPTTAELLARIEALEAELEEKAQNLTAALAEKTEMLDGKLVEKTEFLDGKLAEKTEFLDGKLTANTQMLEGKLNESKVELLGITQAHAQTLEAHANSLVTMQDHPDRLKEAEGTLSEVEANIEWSASIIEDTGSIRVRYKKIVSSGGGIDEIGLFVAPFYTTRRTDGEQGFVNDQGPTLASFNPELRTLPASPSHSKLGGYFEVNKAITNGFINGQYNLNQGTYHPDHPLTELKITVIPVRDGALGENVNIRLRIPQDQWKRIYDNYLENAQNGV